MKNYEKPMVQVISVKLKDGIMNEEQGTHQEWSSTELNED